MEKVIFTDPDTKREKIEFYVLEETQINGKNFFFNRRRGWRQ